MPRLKLKYAPNAELDAIQTSAVCKFAKLKPIKAILWHRFGTGKTRTGLGLFAKLLESTSLPAYCIFIAKPKFLGGLKEEVERIGLDAQISSHENHYKISIKRPTIFFCSFANLQSILQEFSWIQKHLKLIIVDELYLFSNPNTLRSKNLRELSMCRSVIGLSGTILPCRDNFAVWGQCRSISLERKIALSATNFRQLYQTSYKADFGRGSVRLFQNARGWEKKIYSRLGQNISLYFPKILNRTVENVTKVPLTKIQSNLINQLVKDFFMEYEGREYEFKYTLQIIQKIRGIVNGWLETERGRETIVSNKVALLSDQLIEMVACGEQCLVWCAFRNDIFHLQSNIKIANLQLVGGKQFDVDAYRTGNYPIVYATLGSGSSVDYLSKISHVKFFSLGYKPLDYNQAKGRTDRRSSGEDHVANYQHIQCEKSIDETIFSHLYKSIATERNFIESWIQHSRSVLEKKT